MKTPKTLSEGQRAYEAKRAAKAGMNLEKWLASKQRQQEIEARAKVKAAEPAKPAKKPWPVRPPARARAQAAVTPAGPCATARRSSRTRTGASIRASVGSPRRAGARGVCGWPRPRRWATSRHSLDECGPPPRAARSRSALICRSACRVATRHAAEQRLPAFPGRDRDAAGFLSGLRLARR